MNNVLNNLVGFPAAGFMIYLMNTTRFGRRGAFAFGLFVIVVASCMRVVSVLIDSTLMAMISSYLGLFGAMGSLAVGHSFTAEFYPTIVRTRVEHFAIFEKLVLFITFRILTLEFYWNTYSRFVA